MKKGDDTWHLHGSGASQPSVSALQPSAKTLRSWASSDSAGTPPARDAHGAGASHPKASAPPLLATRSEGFLEGRRLDAAIQSGFYDRPPQSPDVTVSLHPQAGAGTGAPAAPQPTALAKARSADWCLANKPWCLACGCGHCIALSRAHRVASPLALHGDGEQAEPSPNVVLVPPRWPRGPPTSPPPSMPRPAPPKAEPLPSVASVSPPRWPRPPKELPPPVPKPFPWAKWLTQRYSSSQCERDTCVWPRGPPVSYCAGSPWSSPLP